jgi:hypothetical protein
MDDEGRGQLLTIFLRLVNRSSTFGGPIDKHWGIPAIDACLSLEHYMQ